MDTRNHALATHLEHVGTMLAMGGGARAKVVTFQNAADHVRKLGVQIRSAEQLRGVRGIGDSVREVVAEFLTDGTSRRFRDLCRDVAPPSVLTMTQARGIGPKKAIAFYRDGYGSLADLATAARAGKLPEKVAREVLIAEDEAAGRWRLDDAQAAVTAIVGHLQNARGLGDVMACGSYRRGRPTVGDLDFVAWARAGSDVGAALQTMLAGAAASGGHTLSLGTNRCSSRWRLFGRWLQADLWIVPLESYGAAVEHDLRAHDRSSRSAGATKGIPSAS